MHTNKAVPKGTELFTAACFAPTRIKPILATLRGHNNSSVRRSAAQRPIKSEETAIIPWEIALTSKYFEAD